jgi:hypothetical protein
MFEMAQKATLGNVRFRRKAVVAIASLQPGSMPAKQRSGQK